MGLEQAPSSPQTLYALTDAPSLFQTTDGGVTWSLRESKRFAAVISSLAVDPKDSETVFALAYSLHSNANLLLRTRNGGRSWMSLGDRSFGALRFDAVDPNLLYGLGYGLYGSRDAGRSWTLLGFANLPVYSLAIDPLDGQTLLASVGGNEVGIPIVVWRSVDRGRTWQATSLASPPCGIDCFVPYLVFDRARPQTAYAFSVIRIGTPDVGTGAVYRSRDGGRSWSFLPTATGILDALLGSTPSIPRLSMLEPSATGSSACICPTVHNAMPALPEGRM